MKINYSKKILLLSAIVLLLILVLDIIFTNLLMSKIININDRVKQLNISSREREKELNLKDAIVSSEAERKKITEYFVGSSNADIVEFTKYLEDLALAQNLTQKKSLDYGAVEGLPASGAISALHFRFNVSGKWSNVFTFLQAIENLPKITYLNSVSLNIVSGDLSTKGASEGNKIWSADLDFSVIKLNN